MVVLWNRSGLRYSVAPVVATWRLVIASSSSVSSSSSPARNRSRKRRTGRRDCKSSRVESNERMGEWEAASVAVGVVLGRLPSLRRSFVRSFVRVVGSSDFG